jgi:quercetin dioxygenase-like cupin family protein
MQALATQARGSTFTIDTEVGFDTPADLERFTTALAAFVAREAAKHARPQPAGTESSSADIRLRPRHMEAVVTNPDRVVVEILVAAPIESVWKALREPAEICRWFAWNAPKLAEEVEMMFVQGVKANEAEHVLYADGLPDRFKLEACGAHTIVRVIRSAPVTDASWQGIYDESTEGWLTFLHQLRFALEASSGADRRTLFFNGRARAAGTRFPADAGSRAARGGAGRPALHRDDRDRRRDQGTIWHRGPYQLGLTADVLGDGLIVVNDRPRTAKSHHGGGTVCITTYGVADAAFVRLRDRWTVVEGHLRSDRDRALLAACYSRAMIRLYALGVLTMCLVTRGSAQGEKQGVTYRAPGGTTLRLILDESNVGPEVTVGEMVFPPNSDSGEHAHAALEMFYVISGELDHVVNGTSQILTPGMAGFVKPPDKVRHKTGPAGAKVVVVWVPRRRPEDCGALDARAQIDSALHAATRPGQPHVCHNARCFSGIVCEDPSMTLPSWF